jgi:hypothetical protein
MYFCSPAIYQCTNYDVMCNVLSLSDGPESDDLLNSWGSAVLSRNRRDTNHELAHSAEVRSFQYSETNVMHFLFSLLGINGLYMFRTLLAHPQEALHKRLYSAS